MAIYKGDKKVIALYKGDKKIIKRYKGTQVIYNVTNSGDEDKLSFEFTGNTTTYRLNGITYTATSSPYAVSLKDLGIETLTSCNQTFYNKTAITNIISFPDTSKVTNMDWMFYGCGNLTSLDVSNFDTSNVTDMEYMFNSCSKLTSLDVSNFDTPNVTIMSSMFANCSKLTSLDVSNFNTSSVTKMSSMFNSCVKLTSLDVSNFNTSSVTNMSSMFSYCSGLTSLDVSSFDTSKVTDMGSMFYNCRNLTSLDVSSFDTSSVTNMRFMFSYCSGLTSLDLSSFDTSSVTDMSSMFAKCSNLTSLDVSSFDTSSVTSMGSMFNSCDKLNKLIIGQVTQEQYDWWCARLTDARISCSIIDCTILGEDIETTSTLTFNWSKTGTSQPTFYTQNSASGNTFYTATTNPYTVDIAEDQDKIIFHNLNVDNISSFPNDRSWRGILIHNFTGNNLVLKDIDLTKATNLYYDLVITASTSSTVDLSGLKLSDTVDMSNYKVPNVNTLNLDGWKFNSLKSMFDSRSALKNLSLKDVNTSNVTSCRETFSRSSGLTSLDLTSMDVSNVTDMYYMFYNCKGLNTIDISGWDMSKVTNCDYMFYNCTGLTEINAVGVIPPITTVTNPQSMFYAADSFTLILGEVSQEYYDWWLTALTKSNVNGTVTIEYTIV